MLVISLGESHTRQRTHPREKLALSSHQGTLTTGDTLMDSSGDGLPLPPGYSCTPPLAAVGSGCKLGYDGTDVSKINTQHNCSLMPGSCQAVRPVLSGLQVCLGGWWQSGNRQTGLTSPNTLQCCAKWTQLF